jgi:hypothetical protein
MTWAPGASAAGDGSGERAPGGSAAAAVSADAGAQIT